MSTIVKDLKDLKDLKGLYKDVPAEQTEHLLKFRAAHPYRQATVGKTCWNYLACGEGDKTLLLLPGEERGGDVAFPLIERWEQEYRVIYPSYPAVPTMKQLVDGLAVLLAREQVASLHLLGISFGGNIAQCFVRQYPHVVEKLILQNTTVPQRELAKPVKLLEKILTFMPGSMARGLVKQMMRQVVVVPQEEQAFWQSYIQEFTAHHLTRRDVLALLRGTIDYRQNYRFTPDDLPTWLGKVLIVESKDDRPITPAMRAALKATYPQAQIFTFQQGGHTPFLLHTEQYFSVVEGFLNDPM